MLIGRKNEKRHIHQTYKQTDNEEEMSKGIVNLIDLAQFVKYIYAQQIH
jgi:hypothetical protein